MPVLSEEDRTSGFRRLDNDLVEKYGTIADVRVRDGKLILTIELDLSALYRV